MTNEDSNTGGFEMKTIACAISVLALAVTAAAQPAPRPHAGRAAAPEVVQHRVGFLSGEVPFEVRIVKGAPFSAEAQTQTVQVLADGNRIVRENFNALYRDSEGRTRREHSISAIGNLPLGAETPRIVSINDPVAGVNYVLHPDQNRATKIKLPAGHLGEEGEVTVYEPESQVTERDVIVVKRRRPGPGPRDGAPPGPAPVIRHMELMPHIGGPSSGENSITEELGTQVMEGVQVEGRRTTFTIPAGEIGNEQPIVIVSESWYSPELQLLVYSRRDDPLVGQTIYRLTKLSLSEPDASLFQIPAGYEVDELPMVRRRVAPR
jgi:hypothetical protein